MDANLDGQPDACYVCSDVIVNINQPDILFDREANISIHTNGKVINGSVVEYNANQEVELLDGFETEMGAEFKAYIAPCD